MIKIESSAGDMVVVTVQGQAFFYNQIRLMVGASLAVALGLLPEEALRQARDLPSKFTSSPLFAMAPAQGLLLVDSGFDRHPKMSIATDAARAAALADPPAFVLLDDAGTRDNAAWRTRLRDKAACEWSLLPRIRKEVAALPADSGPVAVGVEDEGVWDSLGEHFLRFARSRSPSPEALGELEAQWTVARGAATEAEAAKATREAARRAAFAEALDTDLGSFSRGRGEGESSASSRGYRGVLPKGFATLAASHLGLPPGRVVADVQRGLAVEIRRGRLSQSLDAEELLAQVDAAGWRHFAELGAKGR